MVGRRDWRPLREGGEGSLAQRGREGCGPLLHVGRTCTNKALGSAEFCTQAATAHTPSVTTASRHLPHCVEKAANPDTKKAAHRGL